MINKVEGEYLDVVDWKGYLVIYSQSDMVVVKPPEKLEDDRVNLVYNVSSLLNISTFQDPGEIITLIQSDVTKDGLVLINNKEGGDT